jgi:CubicO group peptidase (beta-lactamase class C family)
VLERSFGQARTGSGNGAAQAADHRTLWLLYSNTKVIVAVAMWRLLEQGLLRFTDRVSAYLPGFARHGKRDITLMQVITHRAAFPNAEMPPSDGSITRRCARLVLQLRARVDAGFQGRLSRAVGALGAGQRDGGDHQGRDFRTHIRESVLEPLGLADDIAVGLSPSRTPALPRCMSRIPTAWARCRWPTTTPRPWRRAGAPGGGGYGTARGMAALYQMMLGGGELAGTRLLSPRHARLARSATGPATVVDEFMGMPMHRGAWARTCAAIRRASAASGAARSPTRSAMAAWARRIAGAIRARGVLRLHHRTTGSRIPGTPSGWT